MTRYVGTTAPQARDEERVSPFPRRKRHLQGNLPGYGRGAGVGRGLGVCEGLDVKVGVAVAVAVEVGVTVEVAVVVAVGVGVTSETNVHPPLAGPPTPLQKY